jgi:Outer membrane protein beta-barrel domain
MKKPSLAAIAACLLLSSPAFADGFSGAYLGGGAGLTTSNVAAKANNLVFYTSLTERARSDSGYKLYGGYSWGKIAVEGGVYGLGTYKLSGLIGSAASADQFKAKALAVSVVGTAAVSDAVALHGKLGVARVTADYSCITLCTGVSETSTKSTVPFVGAGMSWSVSKHFAVRADAETFRGAKFQYLGTTAKANYELYSLGAEVRF